MKFSRSELLRMEEAKRRKAVQIHEDAISQNLPDLPSAEDEGLPILPKTFEPKLTPQQHTAISHLVSGRSFSSTATLLKIDRRTLFEWRKKPEFVAILKAMTEEAMSAVVARTKNLLLRSTYRLERGLDSPASFNEAMKIVNSKRVWEIANLDVDPATYSPEKTVAEPAVQDAQAEKQTPTQMTVTTSEASTQNQSTNAAASTSDHAVGDPAAT